MKKANYPNKIFCLLLSLVIATAVFNSCRSTSTLTKDAGVVINGVKWATRNVDKPGTFAAKPQDAGKFYQWNRKTAWSAEGENVENWDRTIPEGTEWETANDPSPAGWRVPTKEELLTLLDTEKVTNEWTTQNGVSGRKFTDKITNNSLFLPAAGFRDVSNGTLLSADGYYWSSTQYYSYYAYGLYSGSGSAGWYGKSRRYGFSIRAVAK
ncbi:MAG: fibrobacter succinogenes major paralogous domain-containing protein [Prevotellaceae bacterium]|nr:fibrobacter succinogenes major paralogous domain-containing protein [Prevotellaceae bacterium]